RAKEDLNFSFGICQKTYHGYVQGNKLINYIEHLYEQQKVKVPECVAGYIIWCHSEGLTLWEVFKTIRGMPDKVWEWLKDEEHQAIFSKAYTDGYEVEEEPKWKIINDQKYCLTSIEAGYGNSLHWAFDSTKKKPILFDNEETALYTAYITGGTVEKV
ncbi:DUF1642 domain-containing protein, partial [Enterococcus malodoratus]|uniref:DUF1642 domain-containing protein n=1 Tax=Enterococcus malodoratus TaxID=71451 RepID=UPI002073CC86